MCISNNFDLSDGVWEDYQSTKSWTLLPGIGTKYVFIKVKDKAGNVSDIAGDSIKFDDTKPGKPNIFVTDVEDLTCTINNRPVWNWSSGGNGCGIFRYKLDSSDFNDIEETPATGFTPAAPLSDGYHTLHVQEKSIAGAWSDTAESSLNIDTTGPSGQILINNDNEYTNKASVVLTLTAIDTGCAGEIPFVCISNSDKQEEGQLLSYSSTLTWNLIPGDGNKSVYAWFKDTLGNISRVCATDTIILDSRKPNPPHIQGESCTTNQRPTWSWTSGGGGIGRFRFKLDNSNLEDADEVSVTSFTPATALADGSHTLYVQEKNEVGNWSDTGSKTINIDTTGPNGNININEDAARTASREVKLYLNVFDNGCAGHPYYMCIANADDPAPGNWEAFSSPKNWTLTEGFGLKEVFVWLEDELGNRSGPFYDDIMFIDHPDVTPNISKALAWLESKQMQGDIGDPRYGSMDNSLALTAFTVLAMCNQGMVHTSPNDPQNAVDRGIRYIVRNISGIDPADYLQGFPGLAIDVNAFTHIDDNGVSYRFAYCTDSFSSSTRTYATALAIMALAATRNHMYDEIIKALGNFLIHSQWDYNSIVGSLSNQDELIGAVKTFGGFGYGVAGSRADNSNTQFALLGIKIAKDFLDRSPDQFMKLQLPSSFLRNLLIWFDNTLDSTNHGFGYASPSATNTMSAAVLWCIPLFYNDCGSLLPAYDFLEEAAVDYLKTHYAVDFNNYNAFYYVFTLSKAILMSKRSDIFPVSISWYKYIADELIQRQSSDGSWQFPSWLGTAQQDYILNTALAVLALELDRIPADSYSAIILD